MTAAVESLYIFDGQKQCVLEHVYKGRPPKPSDLLSAINARSQPRPSVLYLTDLNPATIVYTVNHGGLQFLATNTVEVQALAVLEFLRKVIDIFEDFFGTPLLSSKLQENYEVIAQLLAELCDGGIICNTEANSLHEAVEVSSALGKLFNQITIQAPGTSVQSLRPSAALSNQPSIPWRRANVRHTSNELYVDIVETLHVISAPSGRPISARANGSIIFTAKVSGIPEILLSLSAPGGTSQAKHAGISKTMSLPTFHPCVRLAEWNKQPGQITFVPPDGKFMLAGYEVDLLSYSLTNDDPLPKTTKLFLPASVDLKTGLGATGMDFEARLTIDLNFPGASSSNAARPGTDRNPSTHTPFTFPGVGQQAGTTGAPTLETVSVTIPFPHEVRNVLDCRASRGDTAFDQTTKVLEWKIPTSAKDGSLSGTAVLSGSVVRSTASDDSEYHDPAIDEYYAQEPKSPTAAPKLDRSKQQLMPQSISTSFVVKGWCPSGIKVDALTVDTRKSKGLGDGVKPYKGVKYLCMSKNGVERRVAKPRLS